MTEGPPIAPGAEVGPRRGRGGAEGGPRQSFQPQGTRRPVPPELRHVFTYRDAGVSGRSRQCCSLTRLLFECGGGTLGTLELVVAWAQGGHTVLTSASAIYIWV